MEKRFLITLNTIDKVKNYVNIATRVDSEFAVCSKHPYCVDGKSIMGIFSLDLSKPLTVVGGDEKEMESFKEELVKAGLEVEELAQEMER